jgi:hypothetical protein
VVADALSANILNDFLKVSTQAAEMHVPSAVMAAGSVVAAESGATGEADVAGDVVATPESAGAPVGPELGAVNVDDAAAPALTGSLIRAAPAANPRPPTSSPTTTTDLPARLGGGEA